MKEKLLTPERGQLQKQGPCMEGGEDNQGPGGGWPWRGTEAVTEGALQQGTFDRLRGAGVATLLLCSHFLSKIRCKASN